MPNWISGKGKWTPAKEYVVDPNAPKGKEIYEGPCRAATEILRQEGVEYLCEDFHMNIDLMQRARTLGFKDIDEYLSTFHNYDEKKADKEMKEKSEKIVDHKNPIRKPAIKEVGGGYAQGQDKVQYGNFGTAPGFEGKIRE